MRKSSGRKSDSPSNAAACAMRSGVGPTLRTHRQPLVQLCVEQNTDVSENIINATSTSPNCPDSSL